MTSCIFTIIKNEHKYLDEFIQYHLNIGINHIIIAEDYDSKTHKNIIDKYNNVTLLSVLDFYDTEEKKQRVIYEKTHLFKMQSNYLRNGLQFIKNNYNYDWCFVIDVDEYITIENKHKSLNDVLSVFNEYDAILLQWENYGANGLIYAPDYTKQGIIDTYTQKIGFQKSDENKWFEKVKTIYNMNTYNNTFRSDHLPKSDSNWCKTNFSQDKEKIVYDKIYIRHYITKSWEEYIWKIYLRGMFHPKHRGYNSFFEMNLDMVDKKEELIKLAEDILEKHKK